MQCPVAGEWITRLWKLQGQAWAHILSIPVMQVVESQQFLWIKIIAACNAVYKFALLQSIRGRNRPLPDLWIQQQLYLSLGQQ